MLLATARETKGGIASVIDCYERAGLFARWPLVHVATHCDGGAMRKLQQAVRAFCRFVAMVAAGSVSLVHVHSASNASFYRKFAFIAVAVIARCPVIFHLHGGGFLEFYTARRGALRRRIIRWVLDNATQIVVLSEKWRSPIAALTRNTNISVIPNPITVPSVDRDPAAALTRTVLYLGRFVEGKGLRHLVDAMKEVRRKIPEAKLLLGGSGELEEPLRRYIEENGVEAEFLGWLGAEEKWELLRRVSVYALHSDAEGLPMGVLEAMAVGLPIVATDVGGIPDVVAHGANGILVPYGDVAALSAALSALLSDPIKAEKMGQESRRRFAAQFAADRVIPRVEAIYERLLGNEGCATGVALSPSWRENEKR